MGLLSVNLCCCLISFFILFFLISQLEISPLQIFGNYKKKCNIKTQHVFAFLTLIYSKTQLSSTNCHYKDHLISKPMLKAKSKPHSRKTKSQTISTVHTSKENQKRENRTQERETPMRGERVSATIRLWLAVVTGDSHGVWLYKAWPWLGFHEICCRLHLLLISESKEPISICIQTFQ